MIALNSSSGLRYVLLLCLFGLGPWPTRQIFAADDELRFEHLTEEEIGKLPSDQQIMWREYLARSIAFAKRERELLASECQDAGRKTSLPAPSTSTDFENRGDIDVAWHQSDAAGKLADVVLSFQTPTGGWSKSVDYSQGPRQKGMHWTSQSGKGWHYCGTLDNRSTTEQILFLARIYDYTKRDDARIGAIRGLEWILAAQYPVGGWPQNYPVESGYHEAITLNDNAMTHALEVLQLVSESKFPFEFVDEKLKQQAAEAFRRGVKCLSAMQVRIDGIPTVWCAQHHPITLAPVDARKKEPASLSGGESAEVLKFLMRKGPTDREVVAIIEPALKWFESHQLTGLKKTKNAAGKTDYVPDPQSEEVYWARFYDLQSSKPVFAGADDGVIYQSYSEMAAKNKVAYDYFTTKPRELLVKEVPRWKKRLSAVPQK